MIPCDVRLGGQQPDKTAKQTMEFWNSWIISLASLFLRFKAFISKIPQPPERLLNWLFNDNRLQTLEFLTDVFFPYGVFRFENKLYLVDPKLSKKAVYKLGKGADDYLPSSPLKSSFMSHTDKSPDIRHVIAALFRKSTMERRGVMMQEVIKKAVGKMAEADVVNASKMTFKVSLDILGKVLLGLDLGALDDQQGRLLHSLDTIVYRGYALGQVAPGSQEFRKSLQALDTMTESILYECLDQAWDDDNFVHQLYRGGTLDEAKSNLKLFLMVGTQTMATTLPLMLYVLADMPELQKELQQEADEWIDRLRTDASHVPPKLESALKELLRIYAIGPYISRRADTDIDLGKFTIPAKKKDNSFNNNVDISKTWILPLVSIYLYLLASFRKIPQPPERVLNWLFNHNRLHILEFLSDVYFQHGIFHFQNKLYLLDPKLSLKAVHRLDKGASDYLPSSPLQNSFLNASDKSPDTRHVIAASFRKSAMEQKGIVMQEIIERALSKMAEVDVVNVSDLTLKMAMDIVGKVLLGLDLQSLEGKQEPLLHSMMTILHRSYAMGQVAPDSQEFKESSQILDQLTDFILTKSLNQVSDHDNLVHQLYTAGGTDEARSNLKLFLMAGSETTASSLPVMLYVLAGKPQLQQELQQEADEWMERVKSDASHVPPKLESAIKELLRTYSIAPYISRRTEAEIDLGELTIPAKSDLRIFMWGIHSSHHIWHDSKRYRSDRFMTSSSTSQSHFWFPFGAGSRVCVGQHLAWVEMRLALTYLLRHFTFRRVSQTKDLEFCVDWEHAVVHPDHDVILGVQKRD